MCRQTAGETLYRGRPPFECAAAVPLESLSHSLIPVLSSVTTTEAGNGYKREEQVTPGVFQPEREREEFGNKKNTREGGGIDKKPTE